MAAGYGAEEEVQVLHVSSTMLEVRPPALRIDGHGRGRGPCKRGEQSDHRRTGQSKGRRSRARLAAVLEGRARHWPLGIGIRQASCKLLCYSIPKKFRMRQQTARAKLDGHHPKRRVVMVIICSINNRRFLLLHHPSWTVIALTNKEISTNIHPTITE